MFGKSPQQIEATPTAADGTPMTEGRNGKPSARIVLCRDDRAMLQQLIDGQQQIIKLLTEIRDART